MPVTGPASYGAVLSERHLNPAQLQCATEIAETQYEHKK